MRCALALPLAAAARETLTGQRTPTHPHPRPSLTALLLCLRVRRKEYEVERILSSRKAGGKTEYLVRWKGHDEEDESTWEPEGHLHKDLIRVRRSSLAHPPACGNSFTLFVRRASVRHLLIFCRRRRWQDFEAETVGPQLVD